MNIGYVMQLGVDIRARPFSGQATHVREVVAELRELGHRVRFVLRLDNTTYRADEFDDFVPVTVRTAAALPTIACKSTSTRVLRIIVPSTT